MISRSFWAGCGERVFFAVTPRDRFRKATKKVISLTAIDSKMR
jgi:hypothetical protein